MYQTPSTVSDQPISAKAAQDTSPVFRRSRRCRTPEIIEIIEIIELIEQFINKR